MQKNEQDPVRVAYGRAVTGLDEEKQQRNRDLDPQLVWRRARVHLLVTSSDEASEFLDDLTG